jgi:DNA-binding transcriptional LysR family regulator
VVSTGNTSAILKSIEENTIDVGLVTLPAPGRMFEVRSVLKDEFVLLGQAAAIEPVGKITPSELAARSFYMRVHTRAPLLTSGRCASAFP